eukprot:2476505-Prymnesium_polylepis.1
MDHAHVLACLLVRPTGGDRGHAPPHHVTHLYGSRGVTAVAPDARVRPTPPSTPHVTEPRASHYTR